MRGLELRVPPLAVGALAAVLMGVAPRLAPAWTLPFPGRRAVAAALGIVGFAFVAAGVRTFRRVGTTMDPRTPDEASTLVATGVYRVSRNPMYVGMLVLLAAWAAFLAHPLPLPFLPAYVAYMNRFQIAPEERAMSARFGEAYDGYRRSVRRWL